MHICANMPNIATHQNRNNMEEKEKNLFNASALAEKAGVHRNTASSYLKEPTSVSPHTKRALDEVLRRSTLELDPNYTRMGHWFRVTKIPGAWKVTLYWGHFELMELASSVSKKWALEEARSTGEAITAIAETMLNK